MSFRDKLKIDVRARTVGPKGPSLCLSDIAAKIIINVLEAKVLGGAKVLFNSQIADDSHES